MNPDNYSVHWLKPSDAAQAAEVEARVHAPEHRAGRELIEKQLTAKEWEGRNLSLGLYYRELGVADAAENRQLVGFGLVFVMHDRQEMAEFFDAPLPPELPARQRTLYVSDWGIDAKHRRAARLMSRKFTDIVSAREDLRQLSMDAFSTPDYTAKWSEHEKFMASLGYRLTSHHPFHDAKLNRPMYWLYFQRIAPETRASHARMEKRIAALRAAGDDVYHSEEYLRTLYGHFDLMEEPFTESAPRPVRSTALTSMRIAASRYRITHASGIAALKSRGSLRFELDLASPPGLDRYTDLECLAPGDERGVIRSGKHLGFYHALAEHHAQALGMQIGLLYADDQPIAGLIGFLWQRCFYLVHLTRARPFAQFYADEVALIKLVERCAREKSCDRIDLSQLDRAPLGKRTKRTWPARLRRLAGKLVGKLP